MRLIDADELLIRISNDLPYKAAVKRVLIQAAAVDAVPVVRCRDCQYSYDDLGRLTCSQGVCVDCIVPPGFYCSFGERKEANDDVHQD